MTPDRLRQFLYKPPPMGKAVSLLADQGLGSVVVVVSFTREQVDTSADPSAGGDDLVEEMLAAAVDYCNQVGEPARFQVCWFNAENRQIKTAHHTAAPDEKQGLQRGDYVGGAEPISANRVVSELLGALTQKDKALNASIGTVLLAYEKALTMQQRSMDQMGALLEKLSAQLERGGRKVERSAEEVELEVRSKELQMKAWEKLAELGPDAGRVALAALARAMGLDIGGGPPGSMRQ